MSTLLLRLAGPMQSWGTDSRFDIRFTGREPSKSGVIGVLCAALGKPRQERPGDGFPSLTSLSRLKLGVRVDQPGRLQVDYQTAGGSHRTGDRYGVINATGNAWSTVQSRRYYLADADFLVGLEGDEALLRTLDAAVAAPVWQLSLGRKAFVPGDPVRLPDAGPDSEWWQMGLATALGLESGTTGYPWRARYPGDARPERLHAVLDSEAAPRAELRQDVPLDFATRRFGVRYVTAHVRPWPEGGE
ncbi:MAG: type I-E CRISPR-associated protein Cas5/CasD [Dehalococcoidia bacterium]